MENNKLTLFYDTNDDSYLRRIFMMINSVNDYR